MTFYNDNLLYFQRFNILNVFVVLVDVVIWKERNEIVYSNNADVFLRNFQHYRNNVLLPNYPHDNAQLITRTNFNYLSKF